MSITPSQDFGRNDVDRELISALHARRWTEALQKLKEASLDDSGRARLDLAVATSTQIGRALIEEGRRLSSLLKDEGIDSRVVEGAARIDGTVELVLAPADVPRAVSLFKTRRLRSPKELSAGALVALPRSQTELALAPEKSSPITRLVLRWGDKTSRRGPLGVLNPSVADLAAVSLPAYAWWAYWGIRPVRLVGRKARRSRESSGSAPFVATPTELIAPLLGLVGLDADDLVADLGCGDGRILISAVETFGCRGVGIESDPALASLARGRVAAAGLTGQITIETGDAIDIDFSSVSVVFVFLPASMAARLIPRVLKLLPDGARVVAHEQNAVAWVIQPTHSELVIHPAGITVAYTW